MVQLGIDLGGTKIEIVVLNEQHQAILRKRTSTEQEKGYRWILSKIGLLYQEALEFIEHQAHTVGVAMPGAISHQTKLVKNSNTICLNHQPLQQDLEEILSHPVCLQNDANCFALAEALLGAGAGNKGIVFGVIMGTGCGAGISIDGKIHSGIQGIAGEWGHMQIDPRGLDCYCGKKGCVETYISGGGLQNIYKQRFGTPITVQEIVEGFRRGELNTSAVFNDFIDHFGVAMSNVIDILDPDLVILGGGLSNIDELYTLGCAAVEKYIFSDSLETPIVKNVLGDSAGVFGAAMIGA